MYYVKVSTINGVEAEFTLPEIKEQICENNGITVSISQENKCWKIKADCETDEICRVIHRYTTPLRNFNSVIVPDGGREYPTTIHTINFWSFKRESLVSNVRTPLYIFCGQNNNASFCFGVIGKDYERAFRCVEPFNSRALLAYSRKLTVEVDCKIPQEYRNNSYEELLYLRDTKEDCEIPWTEQLSEFYDIRIQKDGSLYPYVKKGMMPLWCSWTDWFSDDVTEEVIMDNVKAGMELGITNYIIDDGWFGPGLDNPYEVRLNIGDWECDPKKIKDLKSLSKRIHDAGANAIIWCAPHAVGIDAKCRKERLPYLMKDEKGELIETPNKFNILCLRSPESREIMAQICADLITKYDTDGAKYDLYNCIPATKCCSCEHEHDTDSMVIGLERTMKAIWDKVYETKQDYIVELKQNYGGSNLATFGTMMRAGDTPYCPEGNFMRTAYIQAYTPYAINDYQTISNNDTPLSNSRVIIKMIAVGIPTYSMDITKLSKENKQVVKFLNNWYIENIVEKEHYKRHAITASLDTWAIYRETEDIYFLLNTAQNLTLKNKDFQILNGCFNNFVVLKSEEKAEFELKYYDVFGNLYKTETKNLYNGVEIDKATSLVTGRYLGSTNK